MKKVSAALVPALIAALAFTACGRGGSAELQEPTSAPVEEVRTEEQPTSEAPPEEWPAPDELPQVTVTIPPNSVAEAPSAPTVPSTPSTPTTPETPTNPPTTPVTPAPAPAPTPAYAHEWFVATTGSDSAAGSSAQPFKTINRAITAAGPGDRILVRAGSYREDVRLTTNAKDGTAANPILLQGENKPKILAGSASTTVMVSRPHWTIDGFEVDVDGKGAFAVGFSGNTVGSTLKNSTAHRGRAGAGVAVWGNATDVTIEGNTIYDFVKAAADSHGVHVAYTTKRTLIRNNRIYGNSGDSVQCEGPEPYGAFAPADGVRIEGNEMSGDLEQAVDIKTCKNVVIRNNHIHDYATAVVIHMSASNVLFENNLLETAGKGIALGGNRSGPMPAGVIIRGNRIRNITTARGEGTAIRIENADHPIVEHNTILGVVASLAIGGGTGGPTDGLILRNNILGGSTPLKIGSQAPGFSSAANVFGASSSVNGLAISSWLSSVSDSSSKLATGEIANLDTFAPASVAVDAAQPSPRAHCGAGPDIGAVETGCP